MRDLVLCLGLFYLGIEWAFVGGRLVVGAKGEIRSRLIDVAILSDDFWICVGCPFGFGSMP